MSFVRFVIAFFLGCFVSISETAHANMVLTSNFGSTFNELDESNGTTREIPRQFLTPFFSSTDFRSPTQLYGLQGFSLYRVDFNFGSNSYAFQELRTLSSGTDAIAFDPNGDLFVYNNSGRIGRVDINTGVEILVPLSLVNGGQVFFQGIDFSPSGQLYGVDATALYRIDPSTGAVTRITANGVNAIPSSIFTEFDFSATGILRAITFGETVWQIDLGSGIGFSPISYAGSTFSSIATTAIPEPSSLGLVSGVLLTLLRYRYRQRSNRG